MPLDPGVTGEIGRVLGPVRPVLPQRRKQYGGEAISRDGAAACSRDREERLCWDLWSAVVDTRQLQ